MNSSVTCRVFLLLGLLVLVSVECSRVKFLGEDVGDDEDDVALIRGAVNIGRDITGFIFGLVLVTKKRLNSVEESM